MALKRFSLDLASLSAARVVQTLAAFASLPIIARLLGPHEFGLVAVAMGFVVSTIFLADAGMGQSLVRTPSSDTTTWSTAFVFLFAASNCSMTAISPAEARSKSARPRVGGRSLTAVPRCSIPPTIMISSGIIRANSMTELFDFCWVLGSCPPPRGNRLIIQTHSGGPGATAADACGRAGLDLTKFSEETINNVSPYVPHTGSLNNPVDITFSKNHLDFFNGIPKTLLADPNGDGLLIYLMLPEHHVKRGFLQMGLPEDQLEDNLNRLAETISENIMGLPKIHQKPVIGFSYRSQVDRLIRLLQKKGFPVLPSPERAARAMAALVRYQVLRQK